MRFLSTGDSSLGYVFYALLVTGAIAGIALSIIRARKRSRRLQVGNKIEDLKNLNRKIQAVDQKSSNLLYLEQPLSMLISTIRETEDPAFLEQIFELEKKGKCRETVLRLIEERKRELRRGSHSFD